MNGAAGHRPADRAPRERRQRRRREDPQDAFHFARRGVQPTRPSRARHHRGDPCRRRGAGHRPPDLGLRALRRGRGRVPRLTRVPGAPAWTSPSPTGISASSSPRRAAPSGASPRGGRAPRSRSSGPRRPARPARRSPPAASRWSPSATASAPTASPSTARSTGSCPTPTGTPTTSTATAGRANGRSSRPEKRRSASASTMPGAAPPTPTGPSRASRSTAPS